VRPHHLGQAYLMQGSYEAIAEAKSEFVQALALDPSLIWADSISPGFIWIWEILRGPRKNLNWAYVPAERSSSSFAVGEANRN